MNFECLVFDLILFYFIFFILFYFLTSKKKAYKVIYVYKVGFIPWIAEQSLQDMELQEKKIKMKST